MQGQNNNTLLYGLFATSILATLTVIKYRVIPLLLTK